jgi:predicted secreted protein
MHAWVRRLAIFALLLGLSGLGAQMAQAGDRAERRILGFSPDGKVFAFEQYGVEDGSGFPYAEIVAIDTGKDEWLPGTPIRKRLETDGAKVEDARKAAADEAKPLLERLRVGSKGEGLFTSSPTSKIATQRLDLKQGGSGKLARLVLKERILPTEECRKYTELPTKGLELSLETGRAPIILHQDRTLPESRGCPLSYAINDVVRFPVGPSNVYAILIRMEKHGFEGPDTRFIAVTRRLP